MLEFCRKDLGEIQQCIGINVKRNREAGVIMIDQEKYINLILERFGLSECGMSECKPVHTPIEVNIKFDKKPENENSNFQASSWLSYISGTGNTT